MTKRRPPWLTLAMLIADVAHDGAIDKAGYPYLFHPQRVAEAVAGDYDAEAVAWLHDVLEDAPQWTAEALRERRIPRRIVAAIEAITRRAGEEPDAYYARVRANPLALKVKRADIADNLEPFRLRQLDPATAERLVRKYAHALAELDK